MSLSLKHIPCPAGTKCTAFQCIFGHGESASLVADASPQPPFANGNRARDGDSALQNQDGPRKRLKTDSTAPSAISLSKSTEKQPSRIFEGGDGTPPASAPKTVIRPVSPPPLKRARTDRSSTSNSAAPENKRPAALKPNQGSAVKRKPETLNPRLLKSSPASHETRLKLLRMLHQEYTRLNKETLKSAMSEDEIDLGLSDQDLIFLALDEEQGAALEKPAVYANVMKNKIMQYKRMTAPQWKSERAKNRPKDDASKRNSNGDVPKEIETGLEPTQEVQLLKRIITPVSELSNHGYVSAVPTEEIMAAAREGLDAAKGWEKCDRCQQRFQVFPGRREEDGALTTGGACNFHWGKTYLPEKAPGETAKIPKRYKCCGLEVGETAGCFTHDNHVYKVGDPKRLAAVLNYAETPVNKLVPSDRAVCFDCEMGYTVHGMELIRLTATSWPAGEVLLDVLVQPLGEILDLNSRYSGVWPDDMAQALPWTTGDDTSKTSQHTAHAKSKAIENEPKKKLRKVSSPEVARDLLFSLISPTTPLIGHGLENDLNAVRIVHPTLIDTVLLYPHRGGLPFRNSLKMLMDMRLNRKIQQETGPNVVGHDSAEDARAAGDLVRLRIMNEWKDMQRAGWRLQDGEFWPPGKAAPGQGLTEEFIEAQDGLHVKEFLDAHKA